tara:strand:- start:730 stop:1248 length:519 start_codon:yes stop_codon:yes gene_type:complete
MDAKKAALKAKIRAAKKGRQGKNRSDLGSTPTMPNMDEISSMIKTLSDNPDMMKSLMNLGGVASGDLEMPKAAQKPAKSECDVTFVDSSNVAVQLGPNGLMCISNIECGAADVIEYGIMLSDEVYSGCGGLYARSEEGNATLETEDMGEFKVFSVIASKDIKCGDEVIVSKV